jgi:gliding motility-associated-like protein
MPAALPLSVSATLPFRPATEPSQPTYYQGARPAGWARPAAGWLLALLLTLLSGAATTARAQATAPPECSQDEKFINNWYFGYRAGLDFNQATDSIPPKVLTDGRMVAPAGSGVMSDGTGNLLFYSNGDTVWSRNHTIMPNGTGLGGNRLGTDGPLAIRFPGSPATPGGPTRYLLFTQDAQGGPKGLSYSEISIPVGGQGEVVIGTKNTPLAVGTAEKMTGVLHKNGCDVWIIVHGWGSATSGPDNRGDSFLAYRVTPAGVQPTPVISTIGALHAPSASAQGYRGQMKVSPDGEQLAVARFSTATGDSTSSVELFAFDAATGQVSNRRVIDSGAGGYYGVEFSPSRSRLYATVTSPPRLLQFDLSAASIPASKVNIPLKQDTLVSLGSMQAAPDGKIYVARDNQAAIGFIAYPDSLGAKAAYAGDSLQLGGRRGGLGLPNFNQSSLLRVGFGAQSTACLEMTFQAGSPIPNPESYAWTFKTSAGAVLGTSAVANPVFTFPAAGDYQVTLRITNFCFCREVTSLIRVPGAPTPGSIGPGQTVCAGTTPAPLTTTAPAGEGTGQFTYQWQSSADNSTWADINGANAPSYAPGVLGTTTYFRRLVTSGFCAPRTPTASVAITVLPALVAGSIAADQTVCAGTPAAPLTSAAPATGGSGTFAYQWESSLDNATWTAISGANGPAFAPGLLTVTTYFRRQVSSGACAATPSNTVRITVAPGLAAGTIGSNQALCAGATATPLSSDTLATGGQGTITYQWESSADNVTWAAITGATGPTYAPGALSATTYFRRRASSGSGCAPVVSNVVTITVAPALLAGTIGADQQLCPGATPAPLTSTAGASGGSGGFTYQWQSSPDNSNWTNIAGATGLTFTPGLLTATTYFRRGVTSGACGPVYSPPVVLRVLPALTPGSIAASQTVCAGTAPALLTSAAPATGGTGTYTYQWESSLDNSTWTPIPTATIDIFAPGPLTATTYYRRQVSSGGCSTTPSNVVTITVAPALVAGTIGNNQAVCAGTAPAPLSSGTPAGGGTGPLVYQWQSSLNNTDWTDIPGITGDTFGPGALTATTYFRRRVASGVCGPAFSNVVTITVTPALAAGSIGADQQLCPGDTPGALTSTSGASGGTGTFAYQWQSSADNSTWTNIAGATGPTFAPGPLTATTYYRRGATSGACGPVYSPAVTLTVVPTLVAGTIAADQDICVGAPPAPLTSASGASGGVGTYTYQWETAPDNASWQLIPGATGPTFAPGPLTTTTYYRRRVTSGVGSCATVVSNVVVIRVTPVVTPTVTLATPPVQCPGTALTFAAVVTNAGSAPTFRWLVNNVAVASGPTFTSSTLVTGDQVRVEVTPTVGLCSTGLATATVTVTRTATPLPTLAIAVQPGGPVCPGEALTFSIASVTGAGPAPAYQWQVNGTDVAGATTPIFTSTTLREGQTVTLRLRTTNDCGQAVAVVSNGVAVRIQPPVVVNAGPDKEILAGASVVLEGSADGNYPVTWTPALGLTIPANDPLHPVAAPLVTTTYTLSAGAGGCASSDQVTVTVRPAIRIPNAFTPNGDGENDTWQIEFIEQFPDNTVTVFNRWGNKIFSAENYGRANEWRGDINGQPAPVGTYYYVVVTKGPLGKSYAGSITILY